MIRKHLPAPDCLAGRGLVMVLACHGACMAAGGIATDGSVGGSGALNRPQVLSVPGNRPSQVTIPENLGSRRGSNLFHSFSDFNIAKDQTVTFTEDAPNSTRNVISRVTGGTGSEIEGTLRSTPGGHANFYLVNPHGVTFRDGARVDVPGDFHVSTANYLSFKDGSRFVAGSARSRLSSAAPAAFGFVQSSSANNGILAVRQRTHLDSRTPGSVMDVVGRRVVIESGSDITAPGGEIRVVATRGAALIPVGKVGGAHLPLPSAQPSAENAGPIEIRGNRSGLDTSGDQGGGGRIGLWGGAITIDDRAVLAADNKGTTPATTAQGVVIRAERLRVENDATVRAQAEVGSAGAIRIATTGDALFRRGGLVSTVTKSGGKAGNIAITSGGRLTIDGEGFHTGITASAEPNSRGRAGNISVDVNGDLEIAEIGQVVSQTRGSGRAGNIAVRTGSNLVVDARGRTEDKTTSATDLITGIETGTGDRDAGIANTGNAGRVQIEARGDITVRNLGEVSSFTAGPGRGGSVAVTANRVRVEGKGSNINAQAYTENSSGRTGTVAINAKTRLEVSDEGKISVENKTTRVHPPAHASELFVAAPEVILRNGGEISSDSSNRSPGREPTGTADAANLSIMAGRTLVLTDGARIRTTANKGEGGDVTVRSGGTVSFTDSSLSTSANELRNGGNISLHAPVLLLDNGQIRADARAGNGGNVRLALSGLFAMGNILNGQVFSGEESPVPIGDRGATGNLVRAFSESGLNGTITLSGPLLNLSGVLANLGTPEYQAHELNRDCRLETAGTLTELGRGALPRRADDSLLY